MPICRNCDTKFPCRAEIAGKYYHAPHRQYCYECNPPGQRNFWGGKKTSIRRAKDDGKYDPETFIPPDRLAKTFVCRDCEREVTQNVNGGICITCKSKKNRYAKKGKAVEYLGGKCMDCGYDKCIQALDFHHRDPELKKFGISSNYAYKWDRLKKELNKCDLVCCRCHIERHYPLGKIISNSS